MQELTQLSQSQQECFSSHLFSSLFLNSYLIWCLKATDWGREVAQIMYTYVSKCKIDKKKFQKATYLIRGEGATRGLLYILNMVKTWNEWGWGWRLSYSVGQCDTLASWTYPPTLSWCKNSLSCLWSKMGGYGNLYEARRAGMFTLFPVASSKNLL
jgi:hypothetical protein